MLLMQSVEGAQASAQPANIGRWSKGSPGLSWWVGGIHEFAGLGLSFGGVLAKNMEMSALSGLPSRELLESVISDRECIPITVLRFPEFPGSPMLCIELLSMAPTRLRRWFAKGSFWHSALRVMSFWFCSSEARADVRQSELLVLFPAFKLSSWSPLWANGATLRRSTLLFLFANSPARRVPLDKIFSTSYLEMSKLVTAFKPRNLIAAMSYASAASSWVP